MEIQQQRPAHDEFMDAAVRIQENKYSTASFESSRVFRILVAAGKGLAFMPMPIMPEISRYSKKHDTAIIKNEQRAEGYVIGEENPVTFAKNQVARYGHIPY